MSELKGRYKLASNDIACEEFDGEMVVLNLANGLYFALNRSACFIMKGLLKGHAIDELASINGEAFTSKDIAQFFEEILSYGLISAESSTKPTPVDEHYVEVAKTLTNNPQIEVHDDMADLMLADPIHDTDENLGWPAPPKAA